MRYYIFDCLERDVIHAIANENPKISMLLLNQFENRYVKKRELNSRGLFIEYELNHKIPPITNIKSLSFDCVRANIPGLKYGMGFILYIENGYITSMRGYTYQENLMIDHVTSYELVYA